MVNLQLYLPRADPEQNESAKRGLVERLMLLAEDPGERQHVQLHIRLPRLRRRGQELLVKGAACLIPSWRVGLGRQSEMLNIKHSKVCTPPLCVGVLRKHFNYSFDLETELQIRHLVQLFNSCHITTTRNIIFH